MSTPQLCTLIAVLWFFVVSGVVIGGLAENVQSAMGEIKRDADSTAATDSSLPDSETVGKLTGAGSIPKGMQMTRLIPPDHVDRGSDLWDLEKSDALKPGATACRRNHMMEYLKFKKG
jgi:hypothetical protein